MEQHGRKVLQLHTPACSFYRATLCVSAVIAVAQCPSVCHVGALYPNDWRYGQTSFSARHSPTILVFLTPGADTISKDDMAIKYGGWENFAIFNWNRGLSRKRYEIDPRLLWNVNIKSCALSNCENINDLDRPLTRFQGHGKFWSRLSQKLRDKVTIEH